MSKTCLHRWLLLVASRVIQPQVETSFNFVFAFPRQLSASSSIFQLRVLNPFFCVDALGFARPLLHPASIHCNIQRPPSADDVRHWTAAFVLPFAWASGWDVGEMPCSYPEMMWRYDIRIMCRCRWGSSTSQCAKRKRSRCNSGDLYWQPWFVTRWKQHENHLIIIWL